MERRKLLHSFLRLDANRLARLSEWLHRASQRELAILCRDLSDLYDKKLILGQRLAEMGGAATNLALSSSRGTLYRELTTETPAHITKYQIVKAGRREFLVVGGVIMAAVIGATLYYVNPSFRSLVSGTLHEDETTRTSVRTARTTELEETTSTRTYRMTTSTFGNGYGYPNEDVVGYDMHFKIVRRGKVSEVRKGLASAGVAYFQETIREKFGQRIPTSKIRVGFEREEPATTVRKSIEVQARALDYKDGHRTCTQIPLEAPDYDKWNW